MAEREAVEREALPGDVAKQIAGMGYIASHFPMNVGRGRFSSISLKCPYCGEPVGMERIKGDIKTWAETVSIAGFGACGGCKSWSPFDVRLREDGSILAKSGSTWEETAGCKTSGFLSVLKRLFGAG